MERVIFGDNQFFGVNHMSEEKARAQAMRFQDTSEIIRVLDSAYDAGIRAFMCTTHDRIEAICDHVRANPERYADFVFYPCMPYAHKYANAVTEHGLLNALGKMLPDSGALGAVLKGGMSMAKRDMQGIGELLIDAEMKMFHGTRTPVIFLQNVVTDLLLGMGLHEAFRIFADHIRRKYDAEPGFITMNTPMLLKALARVGIENPIICSNINKIGFRMSGGKDVYEQAIRSRSFRPIAMSVLASGAIPAREAIDYVADLGGVEAIVFGASSKANIVQTKALVDELFLPATA
ncbi:hypothetical protein IC608_15090 [Devosia sp. PTR5]|uniref:Uncharacterized protein n=1 Tax=Devosia oryzisoli TaxID=2774138 RepID=A0A927IUF2_9HYPH|nr:hypothetical protein [Devosia oryzisoli]MBD8066798.1 hypothetical protein [Devosia oryzisoli]